MSEQPATDAGTTKPAGEGIDDQALSQEVAEQTDNNLDVEETFERESDGVATDKEAAKATGDDLT